jgi:hypothetical protein
MNILPFPQQIASAHVVFNGPHGAVTRCAQRQGVSRQALYRQAHAVARTLEGSGPRAQLEELRSQRDQARRQLHDLQQRQRRLVEMSADNLACFAATAQAEGVSLPVARRLLAVFLEQRTPSVARLGRYAHQAGERASRLLTVLDEQTRPLVRQAAADEIFVGRKPILMVVEPESLCWQTAQLSERRDGVAWAAEFTRLPSLEQVTRDGGSGLEKGLQQVNAARQQAGQPTVADQADHFHLLREGTWALRRLQGQATRAYETAEKADAVLARVNRQGTKRTGAAVVAARRWREAEAAMDRWSAAEQAWQRVRDGLALFTPTGELNTRPRAEALVADVLPALAGWEWAKVRRQLCRPEVFTFLDRTQERLTAVAAEPGLKELLVRVEGLRRRPERTRRDGPSASAGRGLLLLAAVLVGTGGEAVGGVAAAVRHVLRQACRASSLVEGINSVLRMQQARHRRLTPGLLDLKRLYWNTRPFRTGHRAQKSPYELLGLSLLERDWWRLLKLSPEQLRSQLSAAPIAA